MSAITAFIHKIEDKVTHLISVVEQDVASAEAKVVAEIHVIGGDIAGTWKSIQDGATAEVNRIESDAIAAKQKVAAKLEAIKKALGL